MPAHLDILITAPSPLGDVIARPTFPDRSVRRVVLRSSARRFSTRSRRSAEGEG